jgi:hypothetical protein
MRGRWGAGRCAQSAHTFGISIGVRLVRESKLRIFPLWPTGILQRPRQPTHPVFPSAQRWHTPLWQATCVVQQLYEGQGRQQLSWQSSRRTRANTTSEARASLTDTASPRKATAMVANIVNGRLRTSKSCSTRVVAQAKVRPGQYRQQGKFSPGPGKSWPGFHLLHIWRVAFSPRTRFIQARLARAIQPKRTLGKTANLAGRFGARAAQPVLRKGSRVCAPAATAMQSTPPSFRQVTAPQQGSARSVVPSVCSHAFSLLVLPGWLGSCPAFRSPTPGQC